MKKPGGSTAPKTVVLYTLGAGFFFFDRFNAPKMASNLKVLSKYCQICILVKFISTKTSLMYKILQ